MKSLFSNPLLIKEMREEMRSRKIFFLVPVYIAILSSVAMFAVGNSSSTNFNPLQLASTSRYTLYVFIIAISILLGLIALILGAASITSERERATFELLELTPLSYTNIVLGKFMHSLLIAGLILLSSMPVIATLFFMGGVTYADLFMTLFYLLLFFAAVTLAAICISIVANRTIISIILSLLGGFIAAIVLNVAGASGFREPEAMGFGVISPWLVTWRQVFSPIPLKLAGVDFPVWLIYLVLYVLLILFLLAWAHNALDTRKMQRNNRARILGLLWINAYAATGVLCVSSFHKLAFREVQDIFQVILIALVIILPFFALGSFTDKDKTLYRRRPILESLNFANLLRNHPATGIFYLIVMLITLSITISFSASVPFSMVRPFLIELCIWILPWLLLFIALRLAGLQARAIFVTYLLGTLLFTLATSFYQSGRKVNNAFDFFFTSPAIWALYAACILYFLFARLRYRAT